MTDTMTLTVSDDLVQQTTAFRSWADMLAALENGYIPTLPLNRCSRVDCLVESLTLIGFRVWRGSR